MLSISRDDYFVEVAPRIVRGGIPTRIRIRPLDGHIRLEEKERVRIAVLPMTVDACSSTRPDIFETTAVVEQGCLSFEHTFTGEQEHSIRLHRGEETAPFLRTSVYSLEEDLFRRRPYLGDFHLHSCYSDGVETPEFVAAMYRQEATTLCVSPITGGWIPPGGQFPFMRGCRWISRSIPARRSIPRAIRSIF